MAPIKASKQKMAGKRHVLARSSIQFWVLQTGPPVSADHPTYQHCLFRSIIYIDSLHEEEK